VLGTTVFNIDNNNKCFFQHSYDCKVQKNSIYLKWKLMWV